MTLPLTLSKTIVSPSPLIRTPLTTITPLAGSPRCLVRQNLGVGGRHAMAAASALPWGPRYARSAPRLLFPDINPLDFSRNSMQQSAFRSKSRCRVLGRFPVILARIGPYFA
jgi:hypothetical protein